MRISAFAVLVPMEKCGWNMILPGAPAGGGLSLMSRLLKVWLPKALQPSIWIRFIAIHLPPECIVPTGNTLTEKFNSRLVAPTPCNIKSRRWLRMRPATGFELLLGVVVLTADFKF
jgi:hypothetical protein